MPTPLPFSPDITWERLGAYVDKCQTPGSARPYAIARLLENAQHMPAAYSWADCMRLGCELAVTDPEKAARLVQDILFYRHPGGRAFLGPNDLIATQQFQLTCLKHGPWSVQEFCGQFQQLFLAQPNGLYKPEAAQVLSPPARGSSWNRI